MIVMFYGALPLVFSIVRLCRKAEACRLEGSCWDRAIHAGGVRLRCVQSGSDGCLFKQKGGSKSVKWHEVNCRMHDAQRRMRVANCGLRKAAFTEQGNMEIEIQRGKRRGIGVTTRLLSPPSPPESFRRLSEGYSSVKRQERAMRPNNTRSQERTVAL